MEDGLRIMGPDAQQDLAEWLFGRPNLVSSAENWHHGLVYDQLQRVMGNHPDTRLDKDTVHRFIGLIVHKLDAINYRAGISSCPSESTLARADSIDWDIRPAYLDKIDRGLHALFLPWYQDGCWTLLVAEMKKRRIVHFGAPEMAIKIFRTQLPRYKVEWKVVEGKCPVVEDKAVDGGVVLCYIAALYGLREKESELEHVSKKQIQEMRDWILYGFMVDGFQEEHLDRLK